MVEIKEVYEGSLAARHGILAGDFLIDINNSPIRDVLDYRFYLAERSVTLRLKRAEEEYAVSIRKGEYDDIGLAFETPLMDKKQRCRNGCIFCFIDQNPEGMRESIYFKDDDSRLSFLHGNYITLTNMTEEDVARIIKMRFSPINVSIHTTDPDLRVKMMKNKNAGKVLSYLRAHLAKDRVIGLRLDTARIYQKKAMLSPLCLSVNTVTCYARRILYDRAALTDQLIK